MAAGLRVPNSAVRRISPGLFHVSLRAAIGLQELGTLAATGSFLKPEVFFNGEPLELARWPNRNRTGYWEWATVGRAPLITAMTATDNIQAADFPDTPDARGRC